MANGQKDESRAADVIRNWIRTRYTIEFLGTCEMIHTPNFTLSASEWIDKTNAIGIIVKKGRYVWDDSQAIARS